MISADDTDPPNSTTPYGTPRYYLQGIAMWRFFIQYEKVSYHDYEKEFELGHIILKETIVDHLRQEISVTVPQRPSGKIRVQEILPDIEITPEMLVPVPRSSCDEVSKEVPGRKDILMTISAE